MATAFSHRHRLALALDMDDLVEAVALATRLSSVFGVVKIGLELFSASGPEAIAALRDRGFEVFVDLKLHDTPATVYKAARVLGAVGARYVTLHAQGGYDMVAAGVQGLLAGAEGAGLSEPVAVAVTVLPSDFDVPPHIVPKRVEIARSAGCTGLMCSAGDLAMARELGPELMRIVPGVQVPGLAVATFDGEVVPSRALAEGADLLVVGRSVTNAADPEAATETLLIELLASV